LKDCEKLKEYLLEEIKKEMNFEFKLKIAEQHLNVFAIKGTNKDEVFIYVFTNRKKLNNMQSPLEV
jgi:hypothetical protein